MRRSLRGEQPGTRGRELDRQRQPVDMSADLGDRVDAAFTYVKSGVVRLRALTEQRDGVDVGHHLPVRSALRERQRRHGVAPLGLDGERFAARGQHGDRRTRARQSPDERRGAREMLAVVDDQQQVLGGEEALDLMPTTANARDSSG